MASFEYLTSSTENAPYKVVFVHSDADASGLCRYGEFHFSKFPGTSTVFAVIESGLLAIRSNTEEQRLVVVSDERGLLEVGVSKFFQFFSLGHEHPGIAEICVLLEDMLPYHRL